MGLREEMNRRILFPIILGVLITAIVACLIMLISGPQWVTLVEERAVSQQISTLQDISDSIAFEFERFFQSIADDVIGLNDVFQKIYRNEIYLNDSLVPPENSTFSNASYFLNARQVARLSDQDALDIPDFNLTTNVSMFRPMWYIPAEMEKTQWEYWNNLPIELQKYYQAAIVAIPYMEAVMSRNNYIAIYNGFRYDGVEPSSILAQFPLRREFTTFLNFTTETITDGDISFEVKYYDFAKRPWWRQASRDQSLMNTVVFTDPYLFAKGGYGNTACSPYFSEEQYATDIRVTCIDFSVDTLNNLIKDNINKKNATYFVVRRSNFAVFLHPDLHQFSKFTTTPTIQQLEFYNKSTTEAQAFESSLKALNASLAQNSTMEYDKDGVTHVLTLKLVTIKISSNPSTAPVQYLLGIAKAKTHITGPYEELDTVLIDQIVIQIVVILGIIVFLFIFAWVLINVIAKFLSKPIDDLVRFVKVLKNFSEDNESSDDYDFLIGIAKLSESKYSMEINSLFSTFQNNLQALRFAKEGLNMTNDAEALMSYSKSLKIYREMNNIRGMGIVYNNIANVHFQSGRFDEAIECYKEAIEMAKKELEGHSQVEIEVKQKIEKHRLKQQKTKGKKKKLGISLDALEKIRWMLEEQLNNRYYQLGRAYINLASKQPSGLNSQLWSEVLDIYAKVVASDKESKKNNSRVIICMLDISNAYTEVGDFRMAKQILEEADLKLIDMEKDVANDKADILATYSIPVPILRQKFLLQKAIFLKKCGKMREACRTLTEALESGKKFDPKIRKQCLLELKEIFEKNNLLDKAPNIKKMLDSFVKRNKDIVILLDYSQSMGDGGRINFAVNNILKVFDNYIKPNDRVGFIRFNMNCDIIFSLIEKKKNTIQLRKQLENSTKPSGGTALYTAIYEAIKLFHKADAKNHTKWIVALTDGDDNESRISYEQIFKQLARSDVSLIIIGLALHPAVGPRLRYLCSATRDGVFIESATPESLEVAFQAVSDIIYGQEFVIENITV